MSKKTSTIYTLVEYANPENLKHHRTQTEDEYLISYNDNDSHIELKESNSLVEDEYCLSLESAKYVVEGIRDNKKSMIHHHTKGHEFKHLQFKLYAKKEEIRIFLDILDDEDYILCIKGFLHISQDLIAKENKNLLNYFFNENIKSLANERRHLLSKISEASAKGQITASDKSVDKKKLLELQKETHLKPFFE